jgi:hypothetical protein
MKTNRRERCKGNKEDGKIGRKRERKKETNKQTNKY